MKPAHPAIKKRFVKLRHALARAGFGSEVLENERREIYIQIRAVNEGRQVKTALKILKSFEKEPIYKQSAALIDKIKQKINK